MKSINRISLAAFAAIAAGAAVANDSASPALDAEKVARGKYLVTIGACHDCHTPWIDGPNGPELDMSRMLSGHPADRAIASPPAMIEMPWVVQVNDTNTAWAGPWGVSFTANLTPDRETGLGKWTFRNFKDTIRSGRHLGRGREILPPMPYIMYRQMTDEDLEAVFTFLQSIPPIENRVPDPLPPMVAQAQ